MATLTRNLKLRLSSDLSADARYNLERIDQLGATFNINTLNDTIVRAAGDIQLRPEDNSVGGSGTGGTIELGDPSQPLDSAIINGALKLLSSTDSIHYLTLINSGTSNTSLTIDTGAASRLLTLGGNLVTSGGNVSFVASGNQTVNLPITNAEVASAAAIAGSKISPVFGNQLVSTEQGYRIINGSYGTSLLAAASQSVNLTLRLPAADGSNGQVLTTDGSGNLSFSPAGSGTVTSVGLVLPSSVFDITNSPVTLSGSLEAAFKVQAPSYVFAGPVSGSAATPSFRQLSTNDLSEGTNLFHTTARARTAAVVNSTAGSETDQAPSVSSMKSYVSSSIPNVQQAQVIYVNKNQSGSYTADGSINKPYLTVKAALDAITDASASKKYALVIAPGTYTEDPSIRLKGWVDLISVANDTVAITTSDASRIKWSNNNPGRVFITMIGLTSGIEVLNDNPSGASGMVLDLNNCDVASIIMNGRGGGVDYIQLRNDTRVNGTTTINSAATTIFDSTLIGLLTMTDTGCVTPDVYGSAITATIRSSYELSISITAVTYDVYVDAWGNNPIGSLTIVSNSSYPCTFNTDPSSYPNSISLSGSPAPSVVLTSPAQALSFSPTTSGNWPVVPNNVKSALDELAKPLKYQDAVGAIVADTATAELNYVSGISLSVDVLPAGFISSTSGLSEAAGILRVNPNQATQKTTPVGNDLLLIADSEDSNSLKKVAVSAIVGTSGGSYAADWTSGLSIAVTHNLNSRDVQVEVYDNVTYETVLLDSVVRTDVNTVTLTSSKAPSGAGLRVLVKRI
jgi:hypothetical protein